MFSVYVCSQYRSCSLYRTCSLYRQVSDEGVEFLAGVIECVPCINVFSI